MKQMATVNGREFPESDDENILQRLTLGSEVCVGNFIPFFCIINPLSNCKLPQCSRYYHFCQHNQNLTVSFPWASYQMRKIEGCACAGNAGKVFPHRRIQRKPLVSDSDMHHGTCVTHVPWCMSESLIRGGGENVPGIPGACAPAILLVWQEAHCKDKAVLRMSSL